MKNSAIYPADALEALRVRGKMLNCTLPMNPVIAKFYLTKTIFNVNILNMPIKQSKLSG